MTYPNNTNYIDYPSASERKQMKRDWLSEQGCQNCGEDDPDVLETTMCWIPACPRFQAPPDPRVVYCEDCYVEPSEQRRQKLQRTIARAGRNEAVVSYECGHFDTVEADNEHPRSQPTGPMACVYCGEPLEEVYLDTGEQ